MHVAHPTLGGQAIHMAFDGLGRAILNQSLEPPAKRAVPRSSHSKTPINNGRPEAVRRQAAAEVSPSISRGFKRRALCE